MGYQKYKLLAMSVLSLAALGGCTMHRPMEMVGYGYDASCSSANYYAQQERMHYLNNVRVGESLSHVQYRVGAADMIREVVLQDGRTAMLNVYRAAPCRSYSNQQEVHILVRNGVVRDVKRAGYVSGYTTDYDNIYYNNHKGYLSQRRNVAPMYGYTGYRPAYE